MKYTTKVGNGVPASSDDLREAKAKARRNSFLANSDMYMVEDYPITTEKKTEWKEYRKALRNMDFSDVDNLTWPTKPE